METLQCLLKRIIQQNPHGFTLDLRTEEIVKFGYIASYLETQDSFGEQGLKRCLHHAFAHDWVIGMWINRDGVQQFDSCKVFDRRIEAIEFGKSQKQIAIWDATNSMEIEL